LSETGKKQQKIQKQMGKISLRNSTGCCWICGSQSGVKAGREGYKTRCNKCENLGKFNDDTVEYARLKGKFDKISGKDYSV
jgi:hypothetical protein